MKVSCKARSLASREKNGHRKVTYCKNPGLAFKTHFVEAPFVTMTPTSYVHFY